MNYTIDLGKHSADKDHTQMTGGTLSVDKKIRSESGISFYTYTLPLYTSGNFDTDFHKGIHSAEHLLAYQKDTGSVRNSLEEVTAGEVSGKVILDISPYKTSQHTFGFRITSLVPLELETVRKLTKISVQRAIDYLTEHQSVPFATAKQCGQYNFHNIDQAITDLSRVHIENLEITEVRHNTHHTTAYVCDLRFLKPKLDGRDDMTMFSPDFSYKISEIIERFLGEKLGGSLVIVGTFGCMTGMYLCISSATGDESDIAHIHSAIIEVLKEKIDITQLSESENIQFQTLLKNYEVYNKIGF